MAPFAHSKPFETEMTKSRNGIVCHPGIRFNNFKDYLIVNVLLGPYVRVPQLVRVQPVRIATVLS